MAARSAEHWLLPGSFRLLLHQLSPPPPVLEGLTGGGGGAWKGACRPINVTEAVGGELPSGAGALEGG